MLALAVRRHPRDAALLLCLLSVERHAWLMAAPLPEVIRQ